MPILLVPFMPFAVSHLACDSQRLPCKVYEPNAKGSKAVIVHSHHQLGRTHPFTTNFTQGNFSADGFFSLLNVERKKNYHRQPATKKKYPHLNFPSKYQMTTPLP
jgi:hypothetical protein